MTSKLMSFGVGLHVYQLKEAQSQRSMLFSIN